MRANLVRYQSDMKLTWHSAFILRGVGKRLINKFDAVILYEIEYSRMSAIFQTVEVTDLESAQREKQTNKQQVSGAYF